MKTSNIEELFKLEIKRRAKMEFLLVEDECREILKQGCSKITAYRYFKESARISMSYNTFMHYLRPRKSAVSPKPASPSAPRSDIVLVDGNSPKQAPLGIITPVIPWNNQSSNKGLIDTP